MEIRLDMLDGTCYNACEVDGMKLNADEKAVREQVLRELLLAWYDNNKCMRIALILNDLHLDDVDLPDALKKILNETDSKLD